MNWIGEFFGYEWIFDTLFVYVVCLFVEVRVGVVEEGFVVWDFVEGGGGGGWGIYLYF